MKIDVKERQVTVLLLFLIVSHQAVASDLSYSYLELAYFESDTDIEGTDLDGDGYGFLFSNGIAENLAIFFSYEDQEFDFDFEGDARSLGVDYHTPFSDTGDIVVSFALVDVEVSQPTLGSDDDTGNVIQFGLRNRVSETAEVGAFVSRVDVFDDTETSFGFNLALGAKDGVQAKLGYSTSDDTDVLSIGIRVNY
jgi:hypothetical protein